MSPGGHLVTTVVACAASALAGGSVPLVAAVGVGGFGIDIDHAVDYVLFERQRDLRPASFLRYYVDGRMRRTVLVLHSYELFAVLMALAWWTDAAVLWGYLLGALMHLGLDVVFNGRNLPTSIGAFYCFGYRLARGFDAHRLLGTTVPAGVRAPQPFWPAFFGLEPGTAVTDVEELRPAA